MAKVKFTAEVSVEGFEYYNYLTGQLYDRMKENPEYLKNFGITPNQFKRATACKDKIKKAAIGAITEKRNVR